MIRESYPQSVFSAIGGSLSSMRCVYFCGFVGLGGPAGTSKRLLIVDFFVFISEQWVLVSVLMVLIYLFAINERIKSGRPISVHAVTRMLNAEEAILLDVRDSKEFKAGHIAGAVNIPHAKLKDKISELESYREKFIIIADKVGQQAGAVGRQLQQQNFKVFRLTGGMMEWQNQNLPVIKS